MTSLKNWLGIAKKSVIKVDSLSEQTREGINRSYIPKFLYKPPYGYPRFANMPYIRYLATTPYVDMCVKTIIDEISAIEWDIVPADGMEEQSDEAEIENIRNFFFNPNTNKESFEEVFIKMPVRDLLEVNSGVLNKIYNMKEELVEVVARDGATFTKNPDIHGMYTYREEVILPSVIVPDGTDKGLLNPFTHITQTNARETAAYFQYGWIAGPMPVPYGKNEIIWIEGMKRTDDHYGFSPVQVLAKSLQMLLYMIESDLEYYNDNNVPKGIIGLEESDAEELEAFKEQWFETQRTKDEFGSWKKMMNKVPIVNKIPSFTRIEFSASEMQVIEKQKWYTKMVWASFGVTPTELGYTEDAAGAANQIVQSKVFKKKAINPILRNLESRYNLNIVSEFGYMGTIKTKAGATITRPKYKFVFKVFDVDEEKSKAELYKIQTEVFRTVNEVRKDEGLEPVEGGDEPPTPGNKPTNSFNFSNDGEKITPENPKKETSNSDREDAAMNPKEGQESVRKKSLRGPPEKPTEDPDAEEEDTDAEGKKQPKKKAQPTSSPLIMKEGERPTGYAFLERAIQYVNKTHENSIKEIVEQEKRVDTLGQVKDMAGIIAKIKTLFSVATLKKITDAVIKNNYMDGWEQAEKQLNRNITPDPNAIDYISKYTFDNIKGMNDDIAQNLRQVLQRGFMDGTSTADMKKQITKVFDVGDNRAEMIARTESNRAANFGRLQGYQKSGVKGTKVYSAHLDSRTSPLCKRLDGQEVGIDEDFVDPKGEWRGPVPPAHVNCRSSFIFKIDTEEEE